jgi:hypothetical protein
MPTYSPISAGQIDEDSPVTTALKTANRDNPLARQKVSILAAPVTINNTATPSATGLSLAVVGGATYWVYGVFSWTDSATGVPLDPGPGLRFELVTPDPINDVGKHYLYGYNTIVPEVVPGTGQVASIDDDVVVYSRLTGAPEYIHIYEAYVTTDATPSSGTLALWAAQRVADASDTVIAAGSYIAAVMVDAS